MSGSALLVLCLAACDGRDIGQVAGVSGSGAGSVQTYASEQLDARVSGVGSIARR